MPVRRRRRPWRAIACPRWPSSRAAWSPGTEGARPFRFLLHSPNQVTSSAGSSKAGGPVSPTSDPMTALAPFIDRFGPLAPNYDVVLSDVWGVVHNGVTAFPEACDALTRFRAGGGTVLLITNAPRPADVVVHLLDRLKLPPAAHDAAP